MGGWNASKIKWGAEMCPTSNEGSENLQPRLGVYQKSGGVAFFWFCLRTSSQSVFSPVIRLPYLLPSQYHPATEVVLGDGYAQSGIRQVGLVTRGESRRSLNAGAVLGERVGFFFFRGGPIFCRQNAASSRPGLEGPVLVPASRLHYGATPIWVVGVRGQERSRVQ